MSVKRPPFYVKAQEILLRTVLGSKGYDLPFGSDADRGYLLLLVGLMSFLAVLACAGTLSLHAMTQRWSSGLENKITIEIKAEDRDGTMLSPETIRLETEKITEMLQKNPAVKSFEALQEKEIKKLVSPWLGEDFSLEDIPLPGLIAVELNVSSPEALEKLTGSIKKLSPTARVDTHREWLQDILRFTGTLQWIALFVALIVTLTTVTAISSGVKSRMAVHKDQVEILHLIGASDKYIARQFQWHAIIIALLGSILGTAAGLGMATFILLLSGQSGTSLIPQISLDSTSMLIFIFLPVIASIISGVTARFTVLRTLSLMP
ncbi:MAG: FtsX-like permease family protein [Rhodospirillales bacterium]|nr:FtsX-like permease family protein [Alphaproteobacteria bacterium]MCB9976727.1 FtsX-like permease family protein [Rhodospirillales bacterium]